MQRLVENVMSRNMPSQEWTATSRSRKTIDESAMPKRMPMPCGIGRFGNAMAKNSRKATTVTRKNAEAKSHGGPHWINTTRSGSPIAAVVRRALRLASTGPQRGCFECFELFVRAAETAPSTLIFQQRLQEFFFTKVRPQRRRYIQFEIGRASCRERV